MDDFAGPDATAKTVRAAAKGSYRLPKTVNNTVNQAMSVSITSMHALKGQIKVLDKAIEQQFEIIPNTLTSIPDIFKVHSTASVLKPLSQSLLVLSGFSTSPVNLKLSTPG